MGFPPHKLAKMVRFLKKHTKNLAAPGPAPFSHFWAVWRRLVPFLIVGLHFDQLLASWGNLCWVLLGMWAWLPPKEKRYIAAMRRVLGWVGCYP